MVVFAAAATAEISAKESVGVALAGVEKPSAAGPSLALPAGAYGTRAPEYKGTNGAWEGTEAEGEAAKEWRAMLRTGENRESVRVEVQSAFAARAS